MNEFKESGKPMDESQAQRIFRPIVNGLHALRVRNIVHRDLKPANFLLKTIHDKRLLKAMVLER
jgi:serine/threonine protein kinase